MFRKDRFKGPQSTINAKLGQKIKHVVRKPGTIARNVKKLGGFGVQFKTLENGSIVNHSPHTAWIREDGKQPHVFRHDGLAFVPDPRVYGKCRPVVPKGFAAYKHLPRAKPLLKQNTCFFLQFVLFDLYCIWIFSVKIFILFLNCTTPVVSEASICVKKFLGYPKTQSLIHKTLSRRFCDKISDESLIIKNF